ncbi:hypothetical protein FIBSPDRAFT_851813 [Athelia psychrophila]|uniref:ATPase AAA-type core domain-containing protein n=1 Tax=Athelia psychrophila TaxID=1759441 RepID=A0A166SF89_9AGAM|nr:hypothetical protein FIBSPDRAFT_851813 [Fibularhizoctonia sp. CBS 109695]
MQRSSLPSTSSKHKRTIPIIVLNPEVKEMLLGDTEDFFKSEKWYADRSIPFQRGYLLHRVPGSGKPSLIHAIVGELMLNIYTLSMSSLWISDGTLTALVSRVPVRGIVFLEDLDIAFTRSATRDLNSTGTPGGGKNKDRDVTDPPEARRGPERREHALALGPGQRAGRRHRLRGAHSFRDYEPLERLDPALSRGVGDEGHGDGRTCPCRPQRTLSPWRFGKPLDAARLAFPAKEFAGGCPTSSALQG